MRDPESSVCLGRERVTRVLRHPPGAEDFLVSATARAWVDKQWLVPFDWIDDLTLVSPRMPFVTAPDEWCDAQLWDAASLTLDLETDALAVGFDLKDASAWNILFDGMAPVLCDHGSVQPLMTRPWWAGGQFTRHFLLTLLLSRQRGLRACQALAIWRDGVPPETAARMMGRTRYLSRYWPLMAAPRPQLTAELRAMVQPVPPSGRAALQRHRQHLVDGLRMMLSGLEVPSRSSTSSWRAYTQERGHYVGTTLQAKHRRLHQWLQRTQPAWTLDLGCNTGEFSELAATAGSRVVAVDSDHESVQALYQRLRPSRQIHAVVADIDDLSGGRGWAGDEHPGLATRLVGIFDMVFMLALIHHLAVAAAVPLAHIASFAGLVCRRWLVLELVDSADSQMQLLCAERNRNAEDFSAAAQLRAFEGAGFALREREELNGMPRSLVLLERTTAA